MSELAALLEAPEKWVEAPPKAAMDPYLFAFEKALQSARHLLKLRQAGERTPSLIQVVGEPKKLCSLAPLPPAQHSSVVALEGLVEAAFKLRFTDARRMVHAAHGACTAADLLRPEEVGRLSREDYRAWTKGELANALRLKDDVVGAQRQIGEAREILSRGSGNPLFEARLGTIEANILYAQRQLDAASKLSRDTSQIYLALGERHAAGASFLVQSMIRAYAGQTTQAQRLQAEALGLLDKKRDPALLVTVEFNLVSLLIQEKRFREAASAHLAGGFRDRLKEQPMSLVKLRLLEGQLLSGLGKAKRAETAFLEAIERFSDAGKPFLVNFTKLELADLYLRQGRLNEVARLCRESQQGFSALGITAEAERATGLLSRVS